VWELYKYQEERGMLSMSEEVRKVLASILTKMSELVRKGDAAALAACYSEDTIVMSPNMDLIRGRKAVNEFWEAGFKILGYKDMEFTTVDVVSLGDYATEWGRYSYKAQPKGQKPMEDKGKYITVWKRTPQGWKIHWDIFNSSLTPPK
jgi:ketosteroid isomerase-like protein